LAKEPRKRRRATRRLGAGLSGALRSPLVLNVLAGSMAGYFRLIRTTSTFTFEPDPEGEFARSIRPYIAVGWHGQYFLLPALMQGTPDHRFEALVSRHADGELIARVISRFGHNAVRGSGSPSPRRIHEKGGVEAFHAMRESLASGHSIVASANFLRTSRREVSRGIVTLARISGRPIVPFAIATSRKLTIDSWDSAVVNLPFSRGALVAGDPVPVDRHADADEAEAARIAVGKGIDAAQGRADEIVRGT